MPAGTPPGDYAGGLIIQSPPVQGQTTNVNGDTADRLDVIQRQGVRISSTLRAGTARTTTSEAGTGHAETTVNYAPWPLIITGLLLVLAALYGSWRTVRLVRRARRAMAQVSGNECEAPQSAVG